MFDLLSSGLLRSIPEAPTPGVRNYLRGMWRRKTYRIANKNRTYDPAKYNFMPVKITPRGELDFTSKRAENRRIAKGRK